MLIGKERGIRTPEFHKKMERRKWIRLSLLLAVLIVLIGTPIYLLRTSKFLISSVEIGGNSVTKDEDIQSIVSADLFGNYYYIFPKSSIFIYPRNAIKNDLLKSIPRLESVDVHLSGPRSLKVNVVEREPFALYCADVSTVDSPTDCYFLDRTGYIFSPAPEFSSGVYSVYSSAPGIEAPLASRYMQEGDFAPLDPFIKSLSEAGLYPKAFVLKGDEYSLVLSNHAVIKWNKGDDLSNIKSNLESFVNDPTFKERSGGLDRILYIDLRFGNKVFYKFKDNS